MSLWHFVTLSGQVRIPRPLMDLDILRSRAFETVYSGPGGRSFHQILEDPEIPVIFCHVRNDSDVLFAHSKAVLDLQLMELMVRYGSRIYRLSLERCILRVAGLMNWKGMAQW